MLCIFTLIEVGTILQIRPMEQGYLAKSSIGTKAWICFQTLTMVCQAEVAKMIRKANSHLPCCIEKHIFYRFHEFLNSVRLITEVFLYLVILVSIFKFAITNCQRKSGSQPEDISSDAPPTYDESQRHSKIDVEPPKYEDLMV